MFEVLVYMFEHYIDSQFRPDDHTMSKELFAAGFDEQDINGAFNWFNQLELTTQQISQQTELQHRTNGPQAAAVRIFTNDELKKISGESLGFILFLVQANILNPAQRELILELAMNLPQLTISIEEVRWIVLMTTWGASRTGPDKIKDYLFIEDALLNKQQPVLH